MSKSPDTPDLSGVNLLDLYPVRCAVWEEKAGRVVIRRPRPTTRGLRGVGDLISHWLSAPRIRLDELGSFVWLRLDGRTDVGTVAEAMREHFGAEQEKVEERVGMYVTLLRHEGMLAYRGYDKLPEEGEPR
jgi:hypothetical protein